MFFASSWSPSLDCPRVLYHAAQLFLEPFVALPLRSPSPCHLALLGLLHPAVTEESFTMPPGSSASPSLHNTRGVFQCTARLFVSFTMLFWGVLLHTTPPRGVLHHTVQLFLGFLLHATPEESFSVPLGSSWSPSSHSPGGVLHHPSLGGCSLSDSLVFFVTWGVFGVPYHVALEVSFSIHVFWEHVPVWLFEKLPPYGSFWGVSPHGFFLGLCNVWCILESLMALSWSSASPPGCSGTLQYLPFIGALQHAALL